MRRILLAKYKLGLDKNRLTDVERLDKAFGKPEFLAQAQKVADRGVTLLRNTNQTVPLDASEADAACCSCRFPRTPILIPAKQSSPKFAGEWIR